MAYFDYAANCPVDQRVLSEYVQAAEKYYGNPNAFHQSGQLAKAAIDQASKQLASLFKVKPEEIIYTSGASESNNLAVKGVLEHYRSRGKHVLLGAFEHNSIVSAALTMQKRGWEVELLKPDAQGLITAEELAQKMRPDTVLVSIAAVDSELGIRQRVEELGAYLKQNHPGCIFHTDAAQAVGKCPLDLTHIDLATISAHKFYGLNGSGLLIKKEKVGLAAQIDGGRSTTIFRSGTPVTAAAVAMAMAAQLAITEMEEHNQRVHQLHKRLLDGLAGLKGIKLNSTAFSLDHFINLSLAGQRSFLWQRAFEERGIELSTKSSCCPENTPSKAVYALYQDRARAFSSLRISLSHLSTEEEIDELIAALKEMLKEQA